MAYEPEVWGKKGRYVSLFQLNRGVLGSTAQNCDEYAVFYRLTHTFFAGTPGFPMQDEFKMARVPSPCPDHAFVYWRLFIFSRGVDSSCEDFVSVFLHSEFTGCTNSTICSTPFRVTMTFDDCLVKSVENLLVAPGELCGVRRLKSNKGEVTLKMVLFISNVRWPAESGVDYSDLLLCKNSGDVVLSGRDWEYVVHKEALSDKSPVFKAMFEHDMTEGSSGRVFITDVERQVMRILLLYVYTGRIFKLNLTDTAEKLLVVADKYCLDDLKCYSESYLCDHIRLDKVVDLLLLADKCGATLLKRRCFKLLHAMPDLVRATAAWSKMAEEHSLMSAFVNQLASDGCI